MGCALAVGIAQVVAVHCHKSKRIGLRACGGGVRSSPRAPPLIDWDARLQGGRFSLTGGKRLGLPSADGSLAVHALVELACELDHFGYLFSVPHAALVFPLPTGRGGGYVLHVDRHSLFHILELVFGTRGE